MTDEPRIQRKYSVYEIDEMREIIRGWSNKIINARVRGATDAEKMLGIKLDEPRFRHSYLSPQSSADNDRRHAAVTEDKLRTHMMAGSTLEELTAELEARKAAEYQAGYADRIEWAKTEAELVAEAKTIVEAEEPAEPEPETKSTSWFLRDNPHQLTYISNRYMSFI